MDDSNDSESMSKAAKECISMYSNLRVINFNSVVAVICGLMDMFNKKNSSYASHYHLMKSQKIKLLQFGERQW